MGFEISEVVQNAVMNAVKAGLDNGYIRIYDDSGVVPSDPAEATTGVLLVTISLAGGSTGLTLTTAEAGVISKTLAESWLGTVAETGVASYYRFSPTTDGGGADDTIFRVQGTVGELNADLLLADVNLLQSDEQRIDYYSLGIPGE